MPGATSHQSTEIASTNLDAHFPDLDGQDDLESAEEDAKMREG
jgi:hypothetical protein